MKKQGYILSEREYFDFIQSTYTPNDFEYDEGDARFVFKSHNAWVNGQRFHRMLQMLNTHHKNLPDPIQAVDVGLFPGTWVQLANYFWGNITWRGVGLCISEAFMAWAKESKVSLCEVDLDPFYAKEGVNMRFPFDNNSLDLVVASEIFEHLISPLQFLRETSRTLKSGGLMLLTTPNVSNFGAVVNLIKGDSNYERLERSPMFLVEDEWRGHIRFYAKREMIWLADKYGFDVVDHIYYHDDYPMSVLATKGIGAAFKRGIRRISGAVPHFRGGHIMMLKKR